MKQSGVGRMPQDTEFIISGTGRYLWLLEPLLYMYGKYMPVPLLFFLDRPMEGINAVEVFLRNMRAYHEPCGGLIKDALQTVNKPVVMLGYMDFLPSRKVDLGILAGLEQYMIKDHRVVRGNIWAGADNTVKSSKELLHEGEGFSIWKLSDKDHGQIGSTSLLPALWRKDFLLEFIEDNWTMDAIEFPGQKKFAAQNEWYSVGILPGVFHSCHLCYTADRREVRLSTIQNEEDRAFVAQFIPEGSRIT